MALREMSLLWFRLDGDNIAPLMRNLRGAGVGRIWQNAPMISMRAAVFRGVNSLRVRTVPEPIASVGPSVIRVTATTVCGADLQMHRVA